jgi:hypothetical protein
MSTEVTVLLVNTFPYSFADAHYLSSGTQFHHHHHHKKADEQAVQYHLLVFCNIYKLVTILTIKCDAPNSFCFSHT